MSAWPPAELPGLHVDFGERHNKGWVRQPSATYRCVCGFTRTASGATDVAVLTAQYPAAHRATCRFHIAREAS